jgi:hypothetical protein
MEEIEEHPNIIKALLIFLGLCVGCFCCYTVCLKRKKNPYTEFEDHHHRDDIAQGQNGIINESFRDEYYE